MSAQLVKDLIDAGIHFGHRVSKWNPKMKPYIFGKRNLIHVINVKETLRGILLSKKFIAEVIGGGKDILVVGTKRQARKVIAEAAMNAKMHWVTERWLGGTMTNFEEIRKRVGRLEELEQLDADGMLDAYSKKEGASFRRQIRKMQRNLGGIRNMKKLPGVMIVVDQRREIIAIREARKLGIPVICLIDTDSDPDMVDIPIPGNDDSMRAIALIVNELCQSVSQGLKLQAALAEKQREPRRRSERETTARAADDVPDAQVPEPVAVETPDQQPEQQENQE